MAGADEFEFIDKVLRPLAKGAPEALDLMDDAALIAPPPDHELVVTTDAIVEGVHFLANDPLDLVARKLLRVNLSDVAAKGAKPFGYLLTCAWPPGRGWAEREAFARGLGKDHDTYGLRLLGGDTTGTQGPMVFSATMLGWVKAGAMVRRSGARAGDIVQVSGPIGDGWLGLQAAKGELGGADYDRLAARYRLPEPRLDLDLAGASAAADISDGLIADAGHIAEASGLAVQIDLERLALSSEADCWLAGQPDRVAALASLATGGDDYQIVATAAAVLPGFTPVGRMAAGQGVTALFEGRPVTLLRSGWRHGNEA